MILSLIAVTLVVRINLMDVIPIVALPSVAHFNLINVLNSCSHSSLVVNIDLINSKCYSNSTSHLNSAFKLIVVIQNSSSHLRGVFILCQCYSNDSSYLNHAYKLHQCYSSFKKKWSIVVVFLNIVILFKVFVVILGL